MIHPSITPLPGTHLIVGAGVVGTALALQLAQAGAQVVMVSRRGTGPQHDRVRLVAADASNAQRLNEAGRASGGELAVLYNAANPAYHRWEQDWPPMAAAMLATAEQSGAILATVSNLYGYGPVDGELAEDLPLAATGAKAKVRIAMWEQAVAAHEAGRLRMTEVRGSDYICPGSQSLLGDRVVPKVLAGKGVQLVGHLDQPHTWTAPCDVAATLITVAHDPRGLGRAWHVPSNPPRSQRQAVGDIASAAGVDPVRVSRLPVPLLRAIGLFQPIIRELAETDYQRDRPYVLNDSAARNTFGLAPTPWSQVLADLVAAYR